MWAEWLAEASNPTTHGERLVVLFAEASSACAADLNEADSNKATAPLEQIRERWGQVRRAVSLNPNLPVSFMVDEVRSLDEFKVFVQRPSWALDLLAEPKLLERLCAFEQVNVFGFVDALVLDESSPLRRLLPVLDDLNEAHLLTPDLLLLRELLQKEDFEKDGYALRSRLINEEKQHKLGVEAWERIDMLTYHSVVTLLSYAAMIIDAIPHHPRLVGEAFARHFELPEPYVPLMP